MGPAGLKMLGHEVPVGMLLILKAAMVGVPWIVCLTETGHHDHPITATLDNLAPDTWWSKQYDGKQGAVLRLNDSNVLFGHAPLDEQTRRKDWLRAYQELKSRIDNQKEVKNV